MSKGRAPRVKLPPDFQNKPGDEEINRALAIYNNTGNYLALWQVFADCIKFSRPLPDAVAAIFQAMAHQLLNLSSEDLPKARSHVPDVVLGTTAQAGGPSVFQAYAQELRNRKYLAVIDELVTEQILEKPLTPLARKGAEKQTYIGTAAMRRDEEAHARTLQWVFETAAAKLSTPKNIVEAEFLKRLYEQENKAAGTFRIGAVVAAKRKPEIVELSASPSRRGRKRADSEE